jgi:hypothetical protein
MGASSASKAALLSACAIHLDSLMKQWGFGRPARGLVYTRRPNSDIVQALILHAGMGRRGDDRDVLYIEPHVRLTFHSVATEARRLAQVLPDADARTSNWEPTFDSNLGLLAPDHKWRHWGAARTEDIPARCLEVGESFRSWGLPLLDGWRDVSGLIHSYERGDRVVDLSDNGMVQLAAAFRISGRPDDAARIFRHEVSKRPESLTLYGYESIAQQLELDAVRAASHR